MWADIRRAAPQHVPAFGQIDRNPLFELVPHFAVRVPVAIADGQKDVVLEVLFGPVPAFVAAREQLFALRVPSDLFPLLLFGGEFRWRRVVVVAFDLVQKPGWKRRTGP